MSTRAPVRITTSLADSSSVSPCSLDEARRRSAQSRLGPGLKPGRVTTVPAPRQLPVAEARDEVVVHEADRLHERVADRRADEGEAAPAQVAAERIRFRRPRGNPAERAPAVLPLGATDGRP